MDRRRFLQIAMAAPFVVEGAVKAVAHVPPRIAVIKTRACYTDLFVDRLPYIDEIIMSNYLTDNQTWFLLAEKQNDALFGRASGA